MADCIDVYDAIALTLRANADELSNRTTLQKLIYFETLRIKPLETIMYRNHFYGPFSHQVASALDEMLAFSYLHEHVHSKYHFESYHYELTQLGKKYADRALDKFSGEFEIISGIVKACDEHCKLQAKSLSYSAKAHYILVNGGKKEYMIEDVAKIAKRFDWEIAPDDAENGLKLLEDLGFARHT